MASSRAREPSSVSQTKQSSNNLTFSVPKRHFGLSQPLYAQEPFVSHQWWVTPPEPVQRRYLNPLFTDAGIRYYWSLGGHSDLIIPVLAESLRTSFTILCKAMLLSVSAKGSVNRHGRLHGAFL